MPPLLTSCSPVTKLNFRAVRKFWTHFGAMYQENMKRKEVSWISSSKAFRKLCVSMTNSPPPWILSPKTLTLINYNKTNYNKLILAYKHECWYNIVLLLCIKDIISLHFMFIVEVDSFPSYVSFKVPAHGGMFSRLICNKKKNIFINLICLLSIENTTNITI